MFSITLQTTDTAITQGDVLGRLGYAASSETGADAILVSAIIKAVAEGDFDANNNPTSLVFCTASSEDADSVGSEHMRLTSLGRLGINTSSPSSKLEIAGDGSTTDDGIITVNDPSSGGTTSWIKLYADDGYDDLTWHISYADTSMFRDLEFRSSFSSVREVSISESGTLNVEANGTSTKRFKAYDFYSTTYNTAALPAYTFANDLDTGMWLASANNLCWSTAGVERMRIDGNGDVGINTTNPTEELHVVHPDGTNGFKISDSAGNGLVFGEGVYSTGATYTGMSHTALTASNEYMIMSAGASTLVSSKATYPTYVRSGANATTYQAIVGDNQFAIGSYTYNTGANRANKLIVDAEGLMANKNIYIDRYLEGSLAVGWYTVAINPGNRACGRFGLTCQSSGRHQGVIFYASHYYGSGNEITVLHNNAYSTSNPVAKIRIKEGGTYQGCLLQVYIDDATNSPEVFLLGDNINDFGWTLVDWVADGTDPATVDSNWAVSTFSGLTNVAKEVDLDTVDFGTTGNSEFQGSITCNTSAVFNESGGNNDFRVEGDIDTYLLFADASTDNIGIGTSLPTEKLTLAGNVKTSNGGVGTEDDGLFMSFPGGGTDSNGGSTQTGYLKVQLPVSWTNTMISFDLDIYEYNADGNAACRKLRLGGYNYTSQLWVRTIAIYDGSGAVDHNLKAHFGHDGSKCAIYISKMTTAGVDSGASSSWSYAQAFVTNVFGGYAATTMANWADGWDVTFTTSLGTISQTHEVNRSFKLNDSSYVFNPNNIGTVDLQYKGATEDHLLSIDASTDRIGIGVQFPSVTLDVIGTSSFRGNVYLGDGSIPLVSSPIRATEEVYFKENIIAATGITLNDSVPSTTTNVLYNDAGTLMWDGSQVGSGGSSNLVRGSFAITSSTTVFTVSGGYATNSLDVYQNGIKLFKGASYDFTETGGGTTFTLANAATNGDLIEYVALNASTSATGNTSLGSVSVTTNQTVFNTSDTFTSSNLAVFLNGVKLVDGTDYNVTSSSQFTLTSTAVSGDVVEYIAYGATVASSNLSKTGDTMTGNLTVNADLIVTGYKETHTDNGNTGTAQTIDISDSTLQTYTLTGNCTFTMPTADAGRSFTVFIKTGAGSLTATFTGAKFPDNVAPTISTAANRMDILTFYSDGTNWYGSAQQEYHV